MHRAPPRHGSIVVLGLRFSGSDGLRRVEHPAPALFKSLAKIADVIFAAFDQEVVGFGRVREPGSVHLQHAGHNQPIEKGGSASLHRHRELLRALPGFGGR